MKSRARTIPPWLLVLVGYLALGIALTWPLATRLLSDLPGSPHKDGLEDAYQNVWNLWWTVQALARPTNLWATDLLFYPDGPNLLFHTLAPINTLLAAPVTALWGPIAGFNAVALASFALGGLGMWLLTRRRAGDGPALLAGIVYVAGPFHMAALVTDGQLQIFALHWLPWYISFLLEALGASASPPKRPRRDAALAGLFLALTAWTDWYYTLFLLIFTAAALAWRTWRGRGAWLRQDITRLSIAAGVFLVGAGPLVVPMLVEAARADYMTILPPEDPARLSADLLGYLMPPRLHALWGGAPWAWGVSFGVNRRFFVGVSVAALALVALWRRPAARPWGLAALTFFVLSLGASLRVNGVDTGVPLPYALIADLPIIRLTRQPDRFYVLVSIALGVLVAHGAATLAERLKAPRGSLVAALGAIMLLEFWPAPIITRAPAIPPFLASLPPGPGALLEYPFHSEKTYRDAERMLFQTVHGRPISGGYHSRAYPQPQLGLPALRDLRAGTPASDIAVEPGGWAAALRTLGYSYIIGYKQRPLGPESLRPEDEPRFRALVETGLGVAAPTYEDAWLIAYAVPPAPPAPLIQLREGWGPVETPSQAARYRWLPSSAELGLIAPDAGRYALSFAATPAGGTRTLLVEAQGATLRLALTPERRRYTLLLGLPAERTVVRLSTAEPPTTGDTLEGNGDTRPISARFEALRLTQMP